jgi:hypothetical protein
MKYTSEPWHVGRRCQRATGDSLEVLVGLSLGPNLVYKAQECCLHPKK